jgi:hypothetical protein
MTPYVYVSNNPMKYIDPFGLKRKKPKRRKRKPKKIPKTDVEIDEVTVTAKDLSKKPNKFSIWLSQWGWYSQPGGTSFYGGGGWCANSAANTTNGGDINHLLALLSGGGMGGFSGGPLSAATAINKAGSAYVEGEGTVLRPDYKIKKESTGTGQETDSKGQTANIEKHKQIKVKTKTHYVKYFKDWHNSTTTSITHSLSAATQSKYDSTVVRYFTGDSREPDSLKTTVFNP